MAAGSASGSGSDGGAGRTDGHDSNRNGGRVRNHPGAPCGARLPPGARGLASGRPVIRGRCGGRFALPAAGRADIKRASCEGRTMSRVCQITGKGPMSGNHVSHANNKTKRRFLPNIHPHRFWVESERRWVKLRVSSQGPSHHRQAGDRRGARGSAGPGRQGLNEEAKGQPRCATRSSSFRAPAPATTTPPHTEHADHGGEARAQEVRPGRAQARDLQGSQDQVTVPPGPRPQRTGGHSDRPVFRFPGFLHARPALRRRGRKMPPGVILVCRIRTIRTPPRSLV